MQRALARACEIQPQETRATLASFLLVFLLMGSYYISAPGPRRAGQRLDGRGGELAVDLYLFPQLSSRCRCTALRCPECAFSDWCHQFTALFAVSFIRYSTWGLKLLSERVLLDKAFYLWVSLFSLFHISVFWSFMADTYLQSSRPPDCLVLLALAPVQVALLALLLRASWSAIMVRMFCY